MKKLKIVNDETLGLMYASFKANKDALQGSGAGKVVIGNDISRSSLRSTIQTSVNEESILKETAELEKKKNMLLSTIKLKKSNLELHQKMKKSGDVKPQEVEKSSKGFELIHIVAAFVIAFVLGMM